MIGAVICGLQNSQWLLQRVITARAFRWHKRWREKDSRTHCSARTIVASHHISRLQASIYITRLFHLGHEWRRNPICKFEAREKRAIAVFECNDPRSWSRTPFRWDFTVMCTCAEWGLRAFVVTEKLDDCHNRFHFSSNARWLIRELNRISHMMPRPN